MILLPPPLSNLKCGEGWGGVFNVSHYMNCPLPPPPGTGEEKERGSIYAAHLNDSRYCPPTNTEHPSAGDRDKVVEGRCCEHRRKFDKQPKKRRCLIHSVCPFGVGGSSLQWHFISRAPVKKTAKRFRLEAARVMGILLRASRTLNRATQQTLLSNF